MSVEAEEQKKELDRCMKDILRDPTSSQKARNFAFSNLCDSIGPGGSSKGFNVYPPGTSAAGFVKGVLDKYPVDSPFYQQQLDWAQVEQYEMLGGDLTDAKAITLASRAYLVDDTKIKLQACIVDGKPNFRGAYPRLVTAAEKVLHAPRSTKAAKELWADANIIWINLKCVQ